METIWKYQFKIEEDFSIEMPSGAEILSVQMQGKNPCIWVKIFEFEKHLLRKRRFQLFGTGHTIPVIPEQRKYLATFQFSTTLVLHLFEVK